MTTPKRALVLGCGAVAGGAWSIAALASVRQQLNWDPAQADLLVGTSVGAVLAALLAAGVSLDRLLAAQNNQPDSRCVWNHDTDSGGAWPALPTLRLTAPALLRKALKGEVSALAGLCGILPQGRTDMTGFVRLIQAASGDRWPQKNLWLMTVDARTGERRALGRQTEDQHNIALAQAVCAS